MSPKYPDSFIASYSSNCLKSRAGLGTFEPQRYPQIYNSPLVEQSQQSQQALKKSGSFISVYLADPVVRKYWVGGFPAKVEHTMSTNHADLINKMSGKPVSHFDMFMIGTLHRNLSAFAADIQRNGIAGYVNKNSCTPFLLHGADLMKMHSFGLGYGNPFLSEPLVNGESKNFGDIEIRP